MKTALQETEVLNRAIEAFHNETGLLFHVEDIDVPGQKGYRYDAIIRLTTPTLDQKFIAEIKQRLTNATLGAAVHQLDRIQGKKLILTEYVNPLMAERLREMDIAFLDTVGNAYVNVPPVYVYIKGKRPPKLLQKRLLTRAFQPTGLRVVFAFLCNPRLVNAPYRDIAKAATVALGTVGWVMTDLRELGFIVDMGKRGRRLIDRELLLERWVTAYPENLRPKLFIGKYKAPNKDWWNFVNPHDFGAYWGGEVAAAQLTHYLNPEKVTIYLRDKIADLQLAYKLKKDPNGEVELLKIFWDIEPGRTKQEAVPPFLVYADLLASGDPRNIETAKIIYGTDIAELIGPD